MLIFLTAVFLAFHAADLVLTLQGTALGKRERNPLARFLMKRIGRVPGLVLLKVTTVACALMLIRQLSFAWQVGMLAVFSLLGFLVVMNNIGVLRRARRARREPERPLRFLEAAQAGPVARDDASAGSR